MNAKTLSLLLPLVCLLEIRAQLPPMPSGTKSCGIPNEPSPTTPRCKPCEDEYCPDSGADDSGSSAGGSSSEMPPLGPSPHSGSAPPAGEVETPNTVIALNHGGALLHTNDLKIPGTLSGIPLEFTRFYNSRDAEGLGDLMGHGRTWTHSYSWRMVILGGSPRVTFPSGRRLSFTLAGTTTYDGQSAQLYVPPAGFGERIYRVGDLWHLHQVGASAHTFERVVREDSTVLYHLRESKDTRGNKLTYETNAAARVTKAADALGNHIDLTYSQVTINRKDAVNLHTITAAPVVGWNEVIIPAGQSFRWIQAVSAPNAYFEISEVKFYEDDGSGGHTELGGTPYGTGPARAINNGANTFDKAFDGIGSTRFTFCRPNNGIAGLDLGVSGAASVTKIRYHVMGMFSGNLGRFVGMKFEGMTEQPQTHTVLSAVTTSTGDSVEFEYGTHLDESIGQSHSVLENVIYRNTNEIITDEAAITWVTSQEGTSPSIRRSIEPRSKSVTPDIAFDYYPGDLAVKGQPAFVLAGDPANEQLIQVSDPRTTANFTAPDGGSHSVVNTNTNVFRPSSTTDAGGKTTTYSWSGAGFLTSKTTPAGATTFTRNSRGQILTMTRPDGLTVTHTYFATRLLSVKHSAPGLPDRTTTYTRNSLGRVTKATFPDGSFEDYIYNSLGLLTVVREKNGFFTVHTYDTTIGSPTAGLRLSTTRGLPAANSDLSLGETTSYTWHLPGNASNSPARLLATVTDPRERTTAYGYDHASRLVKTTYPDNSIRELVLDTFGNKLSEFDGSTLRLWTYDSFRRVLTHTDSIEGITNYYYGPNGSSCNCYGSGGPTLITSPAGRKTRRTYDLMGRLLTETRGYDTPDAATTTRAYNNLGRLVQVTDPDGYNTTHLHDPLGRVLETTLSPWGFNFKTTRTYSPFGDTLTVTLPGNRTTTTIYDKMSRPVTIEDPLGTVTTITYDLGGRRTAITEAFGTALARTTDFTYNAYDRLVLTEYDDNSTVIQSYHPGGDPYMTTDESGRKVARDTFLTTWTDSHNQQWHTFASTSTANPAGLAHTTTTYNPPMSFTGGTRRTVSAAGRISESYGDELGRTVLTRTGLVTSTSGLTADITDTEMTYDGDGFMLTSTVDPGGLGLVTTYTPDGLARVKTAKDPLNRTTTYTYDKRGNRLVTKLHDNREHKATYDTLSRLTSSTDPKQQKTNYSYWYETGIILTLKDAKNQTTTWTYNLRGQILTKLYANGDDHAYTYDTLGRIATHTTPKNEVCTYTYDTRDRQTHATWNTTTPTTVREYFDNGLLKSIDNTVSKSEYVYNLKNELTSETQTLAGQTARAVSHTYDADGLRFEMNSPSGSPVDYEWTAKAQLHKISRDGPPPLATYEYDKAGRLDQLIHETGITQDKQYDAASQLTANLHKKAGITVSGHGYGHDLTGRRTSETFADGTTPARSYGYDNADQVTSANYGGGQTDTYAFDLAGNRSSATVAALGGTTINYTANSANQYTSITGMSAPSHDSNGNLLLQNNVSYAWDSENRLLSVTPNTPALGEKSLVHSYDGHHRRVTRAIREWTTSGWQPVETTHFIYDGWNVIEEYSTLDLHTFDLRRSYTWGTDLSGTLQGAGGVGGLLMVEEFGITTTAHHFHYDGNGNVTEITDHAGNPTATYRYDAFGNTLVATGSYAAQNRYRFSTKPIDDEVTNASLYYYGYRHYDPTTGRWPSRDPIEEEGGINLYGFVGNDGVNWVDDLGHRRLKWLDFILDVLKEFTPNSDKALEEQGEIARKKAEKQRDQKIEYIDDILDYWNKPKPSPLPPLPPHPYDFYSCEYECARSSQSNSDGEGNSCVYDNCQLVRQQGPMRGNATCPSGRTLGRVFTAPHTGDCGKFCPAKVPQYRSFKR